LAIVDAIVDAHDGEWTTTPRPGGGLTVTLRLPLSPA
jgi:two-component system sensor histidine kinase VanS